MGVQSCFELGATLLVQVTQLVQLNDTPLEPFNRHTHHLSICSVRALPLDCQDPSTTHVGFTRKTSWELHHEASAHSNIHAAGHMQAVEAQQ